ncbi:MAG: energy-coupling factor transporter ATPase [Ruminococcaceae bacterium]|nr:energy-coupling factor transporter ATPase [Oscillospiraceae bacterium]
MEKDSKIISVQNVKFSYESTDPDNQSLIPVLHGVSLDIHRGEFVAVLGHNGSGKSTLAKHFNCILLPTEGTVLVDGINTKDGEFIYDIRQTVGMVFQNPDNQIVATIVEEDVAFAPENLGIEPDEIRRRVDDALTSVGMYEHRESAPHQLSGGQKQRVAIAGIIAMRPECIVLDEPTAMLDPRGRAEVLSTIRRLNRENGITVILITHYMDEAAQCDRVVVTDSGKIILDGTPKEVFSHVELLKEVGLDVPQVTELTYELKKAGIDLPDGIISVEECADKLEELLKNAARR